MSEWTHVVGAIRVDGLPGLTANVKDIYKALGPTNLWDEDNENSTLPVGSEGSLSYSIKEYDKGLPWVIITIWGDLRDYDFNDAEGIKVWWKELLPKFLIVRDAILHVECEDGQHFILRKEDASWGENS